MIKIIKYNNAIVAKLYNRKIQVRVNKDGGFNIHFKKLTDDLKPCAIHTVLRDKVVITSIKISEEAAQALYIALSEYLRK